MDGPLKDVQQLEKKMWTHSINMASTTELLSKTALDLFRFMWLSVYYKGSVETVQFIDAKNKLLDIFKTY